MRRRAALAVAAFVALPAVIACAPVYMVEAPVIVPLMGIEELTHHREVGYVRPQQHLLATPARYVLGRRDAAAPEAVVSVAPDLAIRVELGDCTFEARHAGEPMPKSALAFIDAYQVTASDPSCAVRPGDRILAGASVKVNSGHSVKEYPLGDALDFQAEPAAPGRAAPWRLTLGIPRRPAR